MQELIKLLAETNQIKVTTPVSLSEAVSILSRLSQLAKNIEAERLNRTKPINDKLKEIRDEYRDQETKIESCIQNIRKQMTDYQTAIKQQEEKLLKNAQNDPMRAITAINDLDVVRAVKTDAGSVFFKEKQVLLISSPSLIPKAYMVPNEKAILQALKEGKTVKGCKLITEQAIINRTC